MLVIRTRHGAPASIEDRYTGPVRNAIKQVDQMFNFISGFDGMRKPTDEIIATVQEAAKQIAAIHHQRYLSAEADLAIYHNHFFWVRWMTRKPKPYTDHTEAEIIKEYRNKFQRFCNWLRDKNVSSRFYYQSLHAEIAACEAVLREWPTS